jgi:hypothetical protein
MSADLDFRLGARQGRDLHARLDAMTYEECVEELGLPDSLRSTFYEGPWWTTGDRRPALATDDVAAIQAMSRCLTSRVLGHWGSILEGIHRTGCGWCDYPEEELKAAVGHAAYMAQLIVTEVALWRGSYGSTYSRATPRQGTYQNPTWAAWYANEPSRREANARRAELVAAAGAPA